MVPSPGSEASDRTTGGQRTGVIEHLEDALSADSAEMKDFHVREALQYLEIRDEFAGARTTAADESGQTSAENTD